jgi:hypothetical protein
MALCNASTSMGRPPDAAYPSSPRSFWSPPALNALSPAPVSTTTPIERSQRASSKACVISWTVFTRKALRACGRLMVIHATPSFLS